MKLTIFAPNFPLMTNAEVTIVNGLDQQSEYFTDNGTLNTEQYSDIFQFVRTFESELLDNVKSKIQEFNRKNSLTFYLNRMDETIKQIALIRE